MLHAAASLVYADYAGTIDVSNRTEMRVRHTEGVSPDPGVDLVDAPSARLGVRAHRWDVTLGYSATALAPDPTTQIAPQVFQVGDVGLGWHDRRVRLTLSEAASYGAQNSGFLVTTTPAATASPQPTPTGPTTPAPATSPGAPQALAAPTTLFSGSSVTSLTAQIVLSQRLLTSTSLAYSMAGGLDATSRVSLPFVRGPRGDALVAYSLSRLDALDSRLTAQRGDTSSGLCSPVIRGVTPGETCAPGAESAQLTLSWRRQITRATQAWVGGGAAAMRVRLREDDAYVGRTYPVAVLGVLHEHTTLDVRTLVRLDAELAPILDVRTGILDQRAAGTLSLTVPIAPFTIIGAVAATRSVSSPFVQPLTVAQATAEVAFRASRNVDIGAGARYAWQTQEGLGSFTALAGFAQATFHAPQVKF